MKIKILFLSLLFTTITIGQGLQLIDTVASTLVGKTIYMYVRNSHPIPVNSPNLNTLLSSNNKEWSGNSLTVTTEIDSINAPAGTTAFWSMDIIGVEDTLEFCIDSKFFVHPRRVFPNQNKYIEKISVVTFPKVYVRRKGAIGNVVYDLDMIGY
jgi:hypothetical protein